MIAWDFSGNLMKGYFTWKREIYLWINMQEKNESFCGDENAIYHDWGGNYSGLYIFPNSLVCALKINILWITS